MSHQNVLYIFLVPTSAISAYDCSHVELLTFFPCCDVAIFADYLQILA